MLFPPSRNSLPITVPVFAPWHKLLVLKSQCKFCHHDTRMAEDAPHLRLGSAPLHITLQRCKPPCNAADRLATLNITLQRCTSPCNAAHRLATLHIALQRCKPPCNAAHHVATLHIALQRCTSPCKLAQTDKVRGGACRGVRELCVVRRVVTRGTCARVT
jgi:hypothetical protein